MSGMPHVVETGPLFSKLTERYSNADEEERKKLLLHFYNDPLVVPNVGGNSGPDEYGPTMAESDLDAVALRTKTEASRVSHVNDHWFGLAAVGDQYVPWQPKPAMGDRKWTTGWWAKWRGDAHGIFRETVIRALEISMGLNHLFESAPTTNVDIAGWPAAKRHWPIQFLWMCGPPKFEGWVHWRSFNGVTLAKDTGASGLASEPLDKEGVVTVIFTTPGSVDSPLSLTLLANDYAGMPEKDQLVHDRSPYKEPDPEIERGKGEKIYLSPNDYQRPRKYVSAQGPGDIAVPGAARGLVVVGHARTMRDKGPKDPKDPVLKEDDWEDWSFPNRTEPFTLDGSGSPIVCIAPDSPNDGGQAVS